MEPKQFFDRIYWINSKNRPDRKKNMLKRLEGWEATHFEAVWMNRIDATKIDFHPDQVRRLDNGEIGCFLSHRRIYEIIEKDQLDKTLILEDDAEPTPDFMERFAEQISQVPDDWDMIYLGQINCDSHIIQDGRKAKTHALKDNISHEIYSANRCWLTHAYAVRGKAIGYLLEGTKQISYTIDAQLADLQSGLKVYAFHPNLINQDKTKSSLRKF